MLTKLIRWLYYILFFLTPLLMNSATSEIFELNKMLFIYFITILITVIWVIQLLKEKSSFRFHWFFYPVLLFLFSLVISTLFSIDLHTSLYGYYGRFNGGLFSIITYIILFYIFLVTFTRSDIEIFLKIILLSSSIVILWGLPGRYGYDLTCLLFAGELNDACWTAQFNPRERLFSTLGQPNWLGAYLAVTFFIGLYFYIRNLLNEKKSGDNQYVYLVYLLLNFITLLFTRSRSSLFAVFIGLAGFFLFLILQNKRFQLKRLITPLVLLIFVLLTSIFIFKTGSATIDKYLTLSPNKSNTVSQNNLQNTAQPTLNVTDSLDIRKIVWQGAWDLGWKYPTFGTGVETFAYAYYFTRPVEHNYTSEWDFIYNKAHNEFLNYFATTGLVGLLTYMFMIISVLYLAIRYTFSLENTDDRLLVISIFAGYITILVTNFFGFSTTTLNLFFYIVPAIILLTKLNPQIPVPYKKLNWKKETMSIVVVIFALYCIWGVVSYYLADIQYNQANQLQSEEKYQQAMNAYDEALRLRYEHVYEDRLSYTLANLAFIAAYQDESDLSKKLMSLAEGYNSKTLQVAPKNVLYWKTKAKNDYLFYEISKDTKYLDNAISSLERAEKFAPTDPKLPYTIAVFYSTYPDEKKTYSADIFKEIDRSLRLKSDYRDSYVLRAQEYKKIGKMQDAIKDLEYIVNVLKTPDEEVLNELKDLKNN